MSINTDRIREYVNSEFKGLPKTRETVEIKQNIFEGMEDIYIEGINEGLSDSQAFEKAKARFGNIDELRSTLGAKDDFNSNDKYDTKQYYDSRNNKDNGDDVSPEAKKLSGAICGLVILIATAGFFVAGIFGLWHPAWILFPLSGMVCGVVGIIISYTDCKRNGKKYSVIKGVSGILVLVSVIAYLLIGFLADGWHPWWLIIPVCCMLCWTISAVSDLLDKTKNKNTTVKNIICSIIMVAALASFLVLGGFFGLWHPAWIAFPLGGMLCGICGIVGELLDKNKNGEKEYDD